MLQKETPNTKIISIRIGRNPSEDSNRSYFDDANRQVTKKDRWNDTNVFKPLGGGSMSKFKTRPCFKGGVQCYWLVPRWPSDESPS